MYMHASGNKKSHFQQVCSFSLTSVIGSISKDCSNNDNRNIGTKLSYCLLSGIYGISFNIPSRKSDGKECSLVILNIFNSFVGIYKNLIINIKKPEGDMDSCA